MKRILRWLLKVISLQEVHNWMNVMGLRYPGAVIRDPAGCASTLHAVYCSLYWKIETGAKIM